MTLGSDVRPLSPPPPLLPDLQNGAPPNRAPAKRDAPFSEPSNYLRKFPISGLPRYPNGPLKREREREREKPVSKAFFYTFPSKSQRMSPAPCSPTGSLWREKLHFQGQWFIHSFISVRVPNNEPSHEKRGKIFGHRPRSPTWKEGLRTMGCGLVPQGNRFRHCNLYPSAMQTSARYLPLWLG